MKDLIEREAVLDLLANKVPYPYYENVFNAVDELPSAESKHGHWIRWYEVIKKEHSEDHIPRCKCSECGTEYDAHTSQFLNFCPNCGAKMSE